MYFMTTQNKKDDEWRSVLRNLGTSIRRRLSFNKYNAKYISILKMFFMNIQKAHESYRKHKRSINMNHEYIESNSQISQVVEKMSNKYFAESIESYIMEKTEMKSSYTMHVHDKTIVVHFYTFSHHTKSDRKYKTLLQSYVKKIYTWFYIILLYTKTSISACKTLNLEIFLTPFAKVLPKSNIDILGPYHVNSGFTYGCEQDSTIYIYREEEWFKVLCHETFHNLHLDFHTMNMGEVQHLLQRIFPIKTELLLYESYCEFWATIWNTIYFVYDDITVHSNNSHITFDTFSSGYFKAIESEKLFSCFQAAKVMIHNGLNYQTFISKNVSETSKRVYREKSNVFAYYVIKSMFLYHDGNFLDLLNDTNKNIMHFESSYYNMREICRFVEKFHNNRDFIETISLFERILFYFTETEEHQKQQNNIYTTMRMTLHS